MTRGYFQYQLTRGAGIYGRPYKSLQQARVALDNLGIRGAEIERIKLLPNNARRYYRWRSGRWSTDFTSIPTESDLNHWNQH